MSNIFLEKSYTQCSVETTPFRTRASYRSFYPIFDKSFEHLETLLTIRRSKNVCQLGHSAGLQCSFSNLNTPKGPSYYPKSIMLQFQICYHSHVNASQETKTNLNFRSQVWVRPRPKAWSRALFYPISIMLQSYNMEKRLIKYCQVIQNITQDLGHKALLPFQYDRSQQKDIFSTVTESNVRAHLE